MTDHDDPVDVELVDVELERARFRYRKEQEGALVETHAGVVLCPDCGDELSRDVMMIDERRSARRLVLCVACHDLWLASSPPDIFRPITSALRRAQRAGLAATLTIGQWQATVDHFGNRCAYCDGPWSIIEHATPIDLGGGTTRTNCLPVCVPCNVHKGSRRLEDWTGHDGRALAWLRELGRS